MTLNIAVVGAPGCGKTLFCINWCQYLGATRIYYCDLEGDGKGIISPQAARDKMLVDNSYRGARKFIVNRPGRSPSRLILLDTPCLQGKPYLTPPERAKLLITLQVLLRVEVILNLVDLTCTDPNLKEFAQEIDRYLCSFSARRLVQYMLVGNKLDLLQNGCPKPFGRWFSGSAINISAREWTGFDLLAGQIMRLKD